MRLLASTIATASLLALFALPSLGAAQAQTAAPPAGTAAPPATPPTTTPAPAPGATARVRPARQPLVQRFAEANTTHDGHLTKDQASAAKWPYIVSNFDGIDKDHKGFVSVDDIRGYAAAKRAERRAAAAPTKG